MRAKIAGPLADTIEGARAEAVLRSCVHCGFCNSACPTFQLTGDELDGPRGRIYLMKGALEGEPVGRETQLHLDRCLECRACESVCPSGVEYHRLLAVGRPVVDAQAKRPLTEQIKRKLIKFISLRPTLFRPAVAVGRILAPALARRVPRATPTGPAPSPMETASTRMALLGGCVQAAVAPHFNAAARRVFAKAGVGLTESPSAGCCGAVSFHLGDADEARRLARRNIDAWLAGDGQAGVVATASGCAAFILDYPDLLAVDTVYADRARRVADLVRDPAQVLADYPPTAIRAPVRPRIAVHEPCSQRNGLKLAGLTSAVLARLGFEPAPTSATPGCCGSAGPYALLQPVFAAALREQKLEALTMGDPAEILTANIGCWMHLSETSHVPVRHWLEAVDEVT